ncbi:MAG: hypothetical protein KDE21_09370, partial [Novosphingobium sp.]|nr:hypothetical protein [Novosphingobium sp.]
MDAVEPHNGIITPVRRHTSARADFRRRREMSIFNAYQARFEATCEEEMSLQEYLDLCRSEPGAYATAAERMLESIGEPELVDTRDD